MKRLLLLSYALFSLHALVGQSLIAVQHQGESTFFPELVSALDGAVDGDTLYLSGGSFGEIQINKSIHVVGVGYHPDSTLATNRTVVDVVRLTNGSSGGSIEGLYILSSVEVYSPNIVNNCMIARCWIGSHIQSGTHGGTGGILNYAIIKENIVIGQIIVSPEGRSNLISNNIVGGIYDSKGYVLNNIITYSSNASNFTNSLIKNNIFNITPNANNSIVFNNINYSVNGVDANGNQGNGSLSPPIALNNLFSDFHPNNNLIDNDYHLITNYSGTDGSPVGIYGGLYPWKAGGVPYNPHIRTKNIAPTTNAQGSLNVQIRVAAQEH